MASNSIPPSTKMSERSSGREPIWTSGATRLRQGSSGASGGGGGCEWSSASPSRLIAPRFKLGAGVFAGGGDVVGVDAGAGRGVGVAFDGRDGVGATSGGTIGSKVTTSSALSDSMGIPSPSRDSALPPQPVRIRSREVANHFSERPLRIVISHSPCLEINSEGGSLPSNRS
jgi:hypothetical protein